MLGSGLLPAARLRLGPSPNAMSVTESSLPLGAMFFSFWKRFSASTESAAQTPLGSPCKKPRSTSACWISRYRSGVGAVWELRRATAGGRRLVALLLDFDFAAEPLRAGLTLAVRFVAALRTGLFAENAGAAINNAARLKQMIRTTRKFLL